MRLSTLSLFVFALFYFVTHVSLKAQQAQTPLEKLASERLTHYKSQGIQVRNYLQKYSSLKFVKESPYLLTEISSTGLPIYKAPLNADGAITTGAATLRDLSIGLDLQGENMTVGVWDDGLVKDHIEFGSRIISKEGISAQTHITHVTGTIVASGVNTAAKGMAPKANATTWYFDNDDAEMAALAKPDQTGLLFSNHSYGTVTGWSRPAGTWTWYGDPSISVDEDYRHGFYSQTPQVIDRLAYLAPYYTIVWAAGNDRTEVGDGTHPRDGNGGTVTEGYDCLIPEAVAKNIITVGAVDKVPNYVNPTNVVMSNFSSWGPTDDGRIKPDLVGAGLNVFSTSAVGTNQYSVQNGTSMATPNVTGSLILVQELYNKLHGGTFMRAATLKGLAIHTAKEAGGFSGPDYRFGWGLLDVNAAAKTLLQEDNENTFVKELSIANGQVYTQEINSQANQKITVTICWTDPAGTPPSPSLDPPKQMLVNDLDVRIVDDLGNTQFPWILNPGSPASQATTGDNFRDNVEKIEFTNPLAKKYTIRVTHKGQLVDGKQNFSLIISSRSSLTAGTNYYWIGNTGNWNDGAHWSLTSGGAASSMVPGVNDNVIFDENSFNGIATQTVNVTTDATCKKITWLTDRPAALALNDHRLTLKSDLALSSKNLKITTPGFLRFESTTDRSVNILKADVTKASLEFNGGNWVIHGALNVKKIDLLKGTVVLRSLATSIQELNAAANTILDVSGSTIDSLKQSVIDASATFTSTNTKINIFSSATINWKNIVYEGKMSIKESNAVEFLSTSTINELNAGKDCVLKFSNAVALSCNDLFLASASDGIIKIESAGKATLALKKHFKYCYDNLAITNVDVTGNALANAGLNSSVTNSANWLKENCSAVLFPDFTTSFTCLNALTTFTDNSTGNIKSWSWSFSDNEVADNSTTLKNTVHRFSAKGKYNVALTVSDGAATRSFSKEIEIANNDQPENGIVISGGVLMSMKIANNYQWYKNNEAIAGAVARNFNYQGAIGSYVVATGGVGCNYASQPFLITALEEQVDDVRIFPNPANNFITLKLKHAQQPASVALFDALSKPVLKHTLSGEENFDVSGVKDGIYILEIKTSTGILKRKVIISHDK